MAKEKNQIKVQVPVLKEPACDESRQMREFLNRPTSKVPVRLTPEANQLYKTWKYLKMRFSIHYIPAFDVAALAQRGNWDKKPDFSKGESWMKESVISTPGQFVLVEDFDPESTNFHQDPFSYLIKVFRADGEFHQNGQHQASRLGCSVNEASRLHANVFSQILPFHLLAKIRFPYLLEWVYLANTFSAYEHVDNCFQHFQDEKGDEFFCGTSNMLSSQQSSLNESNTHFRWVAELETEPVR